MTTSKSLVLEHVSKTFSGRTVLSDISIELAAGELLTLLGPSGCGKTTALRIVAGFETADAGRVVVGGLDVSRVPAHRRDTGVVFQAYSLFPHMTALDNIGYGLKIRGLTRSERSRRSRELLELMGLGEHRTKYPHQLSGGQQQRVALARALAVSPQVLLLDEPLSALDAQVRVQLREEIRRIQRETQTTTIMVTHDQEEAMTIADRIAVMQGGRIEQIGTPEELYRAPASVFVSGFLGTVNRVPTVGDGSHVSLFGHAVETVQPHAGGSRLLAHVRPGDIGLIADPEGSGVVSHIVLRGATSSLHIAWRDMSELVRVDLPTREAGTFRTGDRVRLSVHASAVLVESDGGSEPEDTEVAA